MCSVSAVKPKIPTISAFGKQNKQIRPKIMFLGARVGNAMTTRVMTSPHDLYLLLRLHKKILRVSRLNKRIVCDLIYTSEKVFYCLANKKVYILTSSATQKDHFTTQYTQRDC